MKNKIDLLAKLEIAPETMTDTELLACVLSKNPGTPELKVAEKLLKIGSGVLAEPNIKYSSRVRAAELLGKRMANKGPSIFLTPKNVWDALPDVRTAKKEHFIVFYLDTRNAEIKRETVSIGTLNYSLVHPREVFEPAIRNLAASIIVAHNHPSGSLEPSSGDISLTKRLVQAGKILGIDVMDHVIVTRDSFASFKTRNLM